MNAEPQTKKVPRFALELLALLMLLVCIALPFQKTIFGSASISKLGMLEKMDAVQAPTLFAPWVITDDLSTSMAHIPNEHFVQAQASSGELPLWNPLNGAGRPFAGEFQTLQFSFFHQLFPATSSHAYNLGLVFKLLLSGVGCYWLARLMGLSRWSSLAAGIAYAFCPHCLRFNELVDNYCFYPWLSLAFVWFGQAPSLLRAVLTGLLTAAAAYNMHPETFACAAGLGAAFGIGYMIAGAAAFQAAPTYGSFLRAIAWTALIAFVAFCAAAPLVLPLAEFIANGSSYKFASHQIEHVQFCDFLVNLFTPGGTGSTYIGIALGLSLPLGILVWAKRSPLLLALLGGILLFSTRPFGLDQLLSLKPFCYLLPEYTLYAALLLLVFCAGTGLDELMSNRISGRIRALCILLAAVPAVLILSAQLPPVAALLPKLTDTFFCNTEPLPLTVSGILLLVVWLTAALLPEKYKSARTGFLALLAVANCALLAFLTPRELPSTEPFEYRKNAITGSMQALDGRMMATGYNLFQPNTNLVYGIEDFRSTAPLFPNRYSNFLALGSAGAKFCTIPQAPSELNHIFDLAGVKYILSDRALTLWRGSPEPKSPNTKQPQKLAPGLRLEQVTASYDPNRHELFAESSFTVNTIAYGHFSCALAAYSEKGELLTPIRWLNDRIEEVGYKTDKSAGQQFKLSFAVPLPSKIAKNKIIPKLLVRDNWSATVLAAIPISEVEVAGPDFISPVPYQRKQEFPGGLYLYENSAAVQPVYIASRISVVKSPAESLDAISKICNDDTWNESVVIEDPDNSIPEQDLSELRFAQARILDRSADSVLLLSKTSRPAWLVLNDTFYPGWQAQVDGKPVRLYAANHMFRAVPVPGGTHFVTFKYEPASFFWGTRLLALALSAATLVLLSSALRIRIKKQSSTDISREADLKNEPCLK